MIYKIKLASFEIISFEEIGVVANFVLSLLKNCKTVFLNGELGRGKTTLVKKISKKIGNKTMVRSPSFNKMIIYEGFFAHIDCYNHQKSVEGLLEYVEKKMVFVEWPYKCDAKNFFNKWIEIDIEGKDFSRNYTISKVLKFC